MATADSGLALAKDWATSQRWEVFRERRQVACKKISDRRAAKRRQSELTHKERTAHRNVSVDVLAREWLCEQRVSIDTRAYLVDGLLPTLVLGVEKLLTEVSLRGLADVEDEQPDFNPVNYLAQYLMRNNPRYSNFPEGNPYYRSMREVSEDLKRMVLSIDENHLAQLKVGVQQRRAEREKRETMVLQEGQRQTCALKEVFGKWTLPGEESVPLGQVQQAVRLWLEVMKEHTLAAHMRESFSRLFQDEDRLLKEQEFISVVGESDLPGDVFDVLIEHMSVCAEERQRNYVRGQRRELFSGVFADCDSDKTGYVDRLKVLQLFANYYNSASPVIQNKLHNPQMWPVSEVGEAEEEEEVSLSEKEYREFLGEVEGTGDGEAASKGEEEKGEVAQEGEKGKGEEGKGEVAQEREEGKGEVPPEGEEGKGEVPPEREQGKGEVPPEREEGKGEVAQEREEGKGEVPPEREEGKGEVAQEREEGKGEVPPEGEEGKGEVPPEREQGKGEVPPEREQGKGEVPPEREEGKGEVAPAGEEGKGEVAQEGKGGKGEVPPEGEEGKGEVAQEGEGGKGEVPPEREEGKGEVDPEVVEEKGGGAPKEVKEKEEVAQEVVEEKEETTQEVQSAPDQKKKDGEEVTSTTAEGLVVPPTSVEIATQGRPRGLSEMSSHLVTPSGPGSSWNHRLVNRAQLVQLVELFIGEEPERSVVNSLASFLRENYSETVEERKERMEQAEWPATVAMRHRRVNALFDLWDNDRSGYLELEELGLVLSKWKGFTPQHEEEQVEEILSSLGAGRKQLTRPQLHSYIEQLIGKIHNIDFEDLMDYLLGSVKLTFEEVHRGEQRQKFLSRIINAGKTSGLQFIKALEAAISVLQEDGVGRSESSVIMGLLEQTSSLHFVAASTDCQARVVGHKLDRSAKQVSFLAVDTVRPVHVPNIQKHGGVFYFCPDHKTEEYNGSLVVAPLVTPGGEVVGTLSVDTLTNNKEGETSIGTHEINFHQGVGVCLGEVYHWIGSLTKLLKVGQSALTWVHRSCSQVSKTEIYIVEPALLGNEDDGFALRRMLVTTIGGCTECVGERLKKKDDMFREYLFQCVDNSEPVLSSVYGSHHLAYPLRDNTGCAVAVVDLCLPPSPHSQETREVTRVLRILTVAYHTVSHVPDHNHKTPSGVSVDINGEEGMKVLFDQLMLTDIQEGINSRMLAELRSYVTPPPVVLHIIQVLMYILYPEEDFEEWPQCKQHITVSLVKALESYDPLSQKVHPKLNNIKQIFAGILPGSVQGSRPATYVYNWVSVCLPLLEYSNLLASKSHTE